MKNFSAYIFVSLFALILIVSACASKEERETKVPLEILDEKLFTEILSDPGLAECAVHLNIKASNLSKTDSVYAFDPLKDHKVRVSQFDSALVFYANHAELYKRVYENVLVSLSEFQTKRTNSPKDTVSK